MSTRRAIGLSYANQYISLGIQFASTVIISRLLTPEEVGVYAVAMSVVVLAHVLRNFGSAHYVIQEPELTTERIRAASTVNIGLGWACAVLLYLLSPFAADFFNEPGIEQVLHLLALNFVLIPFGAITMAYLQRQMRFGPGLVIGVSSALVSSAVSITGAFLGYSYLALAWGAVAGTLTTIALAAMYRPRELPVLPGFRGISRVFSFGSKITGANILGNVQQTVPEMIIGRMLGLADAAIFSRARGLMQIFNTLVMNGLSPILTPLWAKSHREGENLGALYTRGASCINVVSWTFFGCMSVLAYELIMTLYGEKWMAAAPLLQITAAAAAVTNIFPAHHQALVATGHVGRLFKLNLLVAPVQLLAVYIGAHYSVIAVALVGLPVLVWWQYLSWRALRPAIRTPFSSYLAAHRSTIAIAASTVAVTWATKHVTEAYLTSNSIVVIAIAFVIGSSVWCIALLSSNHPLRPEVIRLLRLVARRGKQTSNDFA